jgi:hypothetical protein
MLLNVSDSRHAFEITTYPHGYLKLVIGVNCLSTAATNVNLKYPN